MRVKTSKGIQSKTAENHCSFHPLHLPTHSFETLGPNFGPTWPKVRPMQAGLIGTPSPSPAYLPARGPRQAFSPARATCSLLFSCLPHGPGNVLLPSSFLAYGVPGHFLWLFLHPMWTPPSWLVCRKQICFGMFLHPTWALPIGLLIWHFHHGSSWLCLPQVALKHANAILPCRLGPRLSPARFHLTPYHTRDLLVSNLKSLKQFHFQDRREETRKLNEAGLHVIGRP